MPFRFSLESVLGLRKSLEKIEEIALHRIVQEITDVNLKIRQLELRQNSLREQRDRDLARSLPAAHLQDLAEQEMWLTKSAEAMRALLRELEAKRLEQLAKFQKAHLEREVLSEVREQKYNSYQREQLRQEQKQRDDLFLAQPKNPK